MRCSPSHIPTKRFLLTWQSTPSFQFWRVAQHDETLRDRVNRILTVITADAVLEANWLNTLSQLELVGARKIAAYIGNRNPATAVLEHWADETRHALCLRQQAELLGGHAGGYLSLVGARRYFQSLDRRLSAWLDHTTAGASPENCYILVTTIVERRAMFLYPLYRSFSPHESVRSALSQIIVEEQAHRLELERRAIELLGPVRHPTASASPLDPLAQPTKIEATLFNRLLDDLERSIASVARPVLSARV